jgi:hypothetical protein
MDMDGNFHDISNNILHTLFPDQREGLQNGKLDNYFLGFSEYFMDVP